MHPPRMLTGAAKVAVALSVLMTPVLFRRPATTISTPAEIGPIAADLALMGEPRGDGSVRGVWTIFPYRIGTILLPDSSVLAIIRSPAPLSPGRPAGGTTARHLGDRTYAFAIPSPSGSSSSSARLLAALEADFR